MSWIRKGNVYGHRQLGRRHHKNKLFFPVERARTKTELRDYLIRTKLAHTNYYRIYSHLGQGYTLYIGPEKPSHGGIRHKPTRKQFAQKINRRYGGGEKIITPPSLNKSLYPTKTFSRVKSGEDEGKFQDEKGRVMTEQQLRIFRAQNKDKYIFTVKE